MNPAVIEDNIKPKTVKTEQLKLIDESIPLGVWETNFNHVRQLYNSDIRKVMYTTSAIESVNSSLRNVITKKGFFENENSVFKIFYLRITGELAKKWNNAKIQNWAKVLNQLSCLDETSTRIARYIR